MKFFAFAIYVLLVVFASTANVVAQDKNVLIVVVDDLRPELGCYGADYIKSPSIDALAAQGVCFDRAYCQQALCGPSRISMMSGMYPDTSGIFDLWTPLTKAVPNAMSMPRYFKQRGYATLSFGKVYHHNRDDKNNWSHLEPKDTVKYADEATLDAIKQRTEEGKRNGVAIDQLRVLGKGPAIEVADVDDDAYADGRTAKQAIAALRRNNDKPFFMCVGFAKPHLPFAAPKRYWDLYQRDQFNVPQRALPADAPALAFTKWGELRNYLGMPKKGHLNDAQTRELKHGYAACVSYSDAQVGKVMAELDRLGLREKTIVVLWGDHGYKLGDYGAWCKHTNLELDTHVPLIVSAPDFTHGKHSDALVEIVDIFPTLAKLTGGNIPDSCDGKSLDAVLADPSKKFRSHALSMYPRGTNMGYSLRTDRWRYTEWFNTKTKEIAFTELYDHQTSPTATRNLANDSEHKSVVDSLSSLLKSKERSKIQPMRDQR